jgi:hypothetical protein
MNRKTDVPGSSRLRQAADRASNLLPDSSKPAGASRH